MTLDEQIVEWESVPEPDGTLGMIEFVGALIARDKARGEVVEAAQRVNVRLLLGLAPTLDETRELRDALARLAEMEQA